MTVADNGIGLPANFDYRRSDTVGLQTVVAIAEHQLQGQIVFETNNGLTCRTQFTDALYKERV